MDWWAPLGGAGELRVTELVADESLRVRALRTDNVREIPLARFALGGRDLTADVGHQAYAVRDGEEPVIRFAVAGDGPWRVDAAGEELALDEDVVNLPRAGSDGVEQVRYLRFRGRTSSRYVHFTGGRLAGERVVLVRGDVPGDGGVPVVACVPAPRSRQLPKSPRRRRQPSDVNRLTWTPEASAAEVALVELLVLSGRHVGLDYGPAAIAGAAREVAGIWRAFTPRPDPLPTKSED